MSLGLNIMGKALKKSRLVVLCKTGLSGRGLREVIEPKGWEMDNVHGGTWQVCYGQR